MAKHVNIDEAKKHFSKLVSRAENGEEIVIARGGVPVARLVPLASRAAQRVPGDLKGKLWIADDFDAPLSDKLLREFEGEPD